MASVNPYQALGVSATATADEIRSAFRKLAKKFHPDLNPGNKEAERRFKEANAAYEIIGDADKRGKFDRGEIDASGAPIQQKPSFEEGNWNQDAGSQRYYYQTQQDGGRYSSAFEGIDPDFFEHLFGGQQFRGTRPPVDKHYRLEVDFKDAILGAEREIILPGGKKLKLKIPPGIESGKTLRLKGVETEHAADAPRGDTYVEITVKPSPLFARDKSDITLELPITIDEAVLGGEVRVPTLENAVVLKVPKGANTGTKLRIKGKGVGTPNSKNRGDLIVTLKVVMPKTIDPDLEKSMKAWRDSHSYNPRETLEREGGI